LKTQLKIHKTILVILQFINVKIKMVLMVPGFKLIRTISKILKEEENIRNIIPEDLHASDIACMKYAPINTADVEQSFLMYKDLLMINCMKLTFVYRLG